MPLVLNMPWSLIYLSSENARFLNMPEGSEYTRAVSKPVNRSEYTSGSEYTKVLNMSGLHRVA